MDIEAGDDDPFSPQEIMCFMLDLTAGLGFLHERNIIHRDLKSDNVFVTLNERKEIMTLAIGLLFLIEFIFLCFQIFFFFNILLSFPNHFPIFSFFPLVSLSSHTGDFDIAKSLSSDGPAMTLVGTPAYMAPEVLAQEGAYSLKADGFFSFLFFFSLSSFLSFLILWFLFSFMISFNFQFIHLGWYCMNCWQ